MKRKLILATVVSSIAISGAGLAMAAGSGGKAKEDMIEAQALQSAKIQLIDASRIALQATPGVLSEMGFEVENGKGVWEASVIAKDGAETDVTIAADTGKIIAKKMAADDHEDENGDDDGEGNEADEG